MASAIRSRRWFQISVRTLLIGVFFLCVWLATICQRARKQEELIRRITYGTRNSITYAHEAVKPPLAPPGPIWLRHMIGDHFFFQPHQVVLQTHDADMLDALAQLNGVEFVMVDGLDDNELKILAKIKTLRRISTSSPDVTSEGFRSLRALTALESIVIADGRIDDNDVLYLAPLNNLKLLSVDGSFVTVEGIQWAKLRWPGIAIYSPYPSVPHELTAIQQLRHVNARFSASDTGEVVSVALLGPDVLDTTLEQFQQFQKLRHVRLVATSVTPAGVASFRKQMPDVMFTPDVREPRPEEAAAYNAFAALGAEIDFDQEGYLRSIVSTSQSATDADVVLLAHCQQLKTLRLHSESLSTRSFEAVANCVTLTTLDVPNAPIADKDLAGLDRLAEMESLSLNCEQLSPQKLVVLRNMKHLESLALHNATLRSGDLDVIQGCASLKSIDLTGSHIGSGALSPLSRLPVLRTLVLRQTDVTDVELSDLRGSQVGRLVLRDTNVSDNGFDSLRAMQLLRSVDATNTGMTEAGASRFQQLAPRCKVSR